MIAEDDGIQAFGLTIAPPLPWPAISTWLERLILLHGDAVLRMRAVLNVQDRPGPVVIHSARHLLVPPVTLPSWPAGASRQTRLAFITRGLPRASIVEALASIAPSADNPAATA
jgi:G3E family GTPase